MHTSKAQKAFFTKALMDWHNEENDRQLPWKQEKDPYKIWLSEVILQQTRAEQGLPYYLGFTQKYPTVKHLAAARDEDVFLLWQGLGYYNRCKNMLATARLVQSEFKGKFPDTYEGLLQLKGIGPYTAAAISSFAFGLPHAVVDGNVYRVLARFFGIDTPIDSTEGKKAFKILADELLYSNDSAGYNQAIMDLGATVCTPKLAKCTDCPLQTQCIAYSNDLVYILPVKEKKVQVTERFFNYLVFVDGNKVWMKKRTSKDIWENLHEPYLVESDHLLDEGEVKKLPLMRSLKIKTLSLEETVSQKLTHRKINMRFFVVQLSSAGSALPKDGRWVATNTLKSLAYPKSTLSFLKKIYYF